jgi:mono/diheme cytochrome c family protein
MKRDVAVLLVAFIVTHVLPASTAFARENAAGLQFFENEIRPILVGHCFKCHGGKKQESELRLDSREALMRGGLQGAAVVPGKPDESRLVQAVRRVGELEMPPSKPLDERQVELLAKWVAMGVPFPADAQTAGAAEIRGGEITEKERDFWSFQPLRDPAPPALDDAAFVQNAIDHFVLARLEAANLTMSERADKRTLIRRATYDLTGFPPTPAEVDQFVSDTSPKAFERLIDRLLRSRAYGERWGRHWLDVVRYADTAGENADFPAKEAYRYRNYVIDAFNADKPYDEFIREQLAGDILAESLADGHVTISGKPGLDGYDPSLPALAVFDDKALGKRFRELVTATGYLAVSRRFGHTSRKLKYRLLMIQDTIDNLGQSVLGLSLGCARCHDHKFDPVNKEDYYAYYGIFESTSFAHTGSEGDTAQSLTPLIPLQVARNRKAAFDAEAKRVADEIERLTKLKKKLEEEVAASGTKAIELKRQLEHTVSSLKEITSRQELINRNGPYEVAYGVVEGEAQNSRIHLRGDWRTLGDEVPRRNLEILGGDLLADSAGSGRLLLANWLTRPENPLTPRVMVNRIWQCHFGSGLVPTANDFGVRGERPTHPELLDWLATRFVESGWSIKSMHRLIMASATYQQANRDDHRAMTVDPDVQLLWRFNRRRLSAEELRDSLLHISGDLDRSVGGEHPFPPKSTWKFTQHSPFYAMYETNRRSIYLMQQRMKRHPFLALFDGADSNASTARRTATTVPTQALYLMNDPFVHERSRSLASRLQVLHPDNLDDQIRAAFGLALSRDPHADELVSNREFLVQYVQKLTRTDVASNERESVALSGFVRTLLMRNEFLFVD